MAKKSLLPTDIIAKMLGTVSAAREREARKADPTRHPYWNPNPGPQELALASEADEIGYGGQAGGGKTDLALGKAITQHRKAIIFRREYPQLKDVIERSREILSETEARYNGQDHIWKGIPGKRSLEFGACQHEADMFKYKGRPQDLIVFDEAADFSETIVRFLMGWNRSTFKGQKCQVLFTFNPPTSAEGEWILRYFGPWIDIRHPNRAAPGELRWFARVDDQEIERPNGEPFDHKGELIKPKSRTFFPAGLADNPFLRDTEYRTVLMNLPEPLRSQLLYGDFTAGIEDNRWQLIPTSWVRWAMVRWELLQKTKLPGYVPKPHDVVGVDVARGGRDKTVLAPLSDVEFAPLVKVPGVETPNGQAVLQLLITHNKGGLPIIDVVGIGSSAYDMTTLQSMDAVAFSGGSGSNQTDKSGKLGFRNLRAEAYWQFREALDPNSGLDIALPDDPELLADLCAPRWALSGRGIQVESKEDIFKRLGRSTDCGDAVVMAWWGRQFRGETGGEANFHHGSIFDGFGSPFDWPGIDLF